MPMFQLAMNIEDKQGDKDENQNRLCKQLKF